MASECLNTHGYYSNLCMMYMYDQIEFCFYILIPCRMHSLYALTISARLTEMKIGNHVHSIINVVDTHFEWKEKPILPHGSIMRCVEGINNPYLFANMHFGSWNLHSNHYWIHSNIATYTHARNTKLVFIL